MDRVRRRSYTNVDADGLGPGGFGARITVSATNVGGFDFIPAQNGRSIDAEAGVVWDATGGPFNNRIYLVYTDETVNENNDTEILMRTSTDDGATWSAPVRVNDDATTNSQFLPYVALDPTTGTVAVGFHDCRNDNGVPGPGGTNTIPNDDAEYYGTFSTDGGATWAPNRRLSGGFSNAADADNGIDFGDYVGVSAFAGKLYAMWADNANCDGTNPNGTLHQFDLYANQLMLTGGTPSPTPTASPTPTPTPTASPTPTATATATPCVGDYTITQIGGSIVPGTTDIGNHGDDTVTTIALPFPYNLYGTTFTSVNLSSNGNAQFMTTDTAFTNNCLPWATHNYTIFPYWDDLYLVNSGFGIFTSISGTAPNRIFNIEWRAQYFPGSGSANFELRLYEGQSRFDVIYGTVDNGNTSATAGYRETTPLSFSTSATAREALLLAGKAISCSLVELHHQHQRQPQQRRLPRRPHRLQPQRRLQLRRPHRPQLQQLRPRHCQTHSNPEAPHHTKATSDSTASSVTGNTRLEKSNQERRNRGKGFPR